jgi:hypothetical protein
MQRKMFWLWRDTGGGLHASSYRPTNGTIRAVIAATARDALLPLTDGRSPKHSVRDADDPSQSWEGRCSAQA